MVLSGNPGLKVDPNTPLMGAIKGHIAGTIHFL